MSQYEREFSKGRKCFDCDKIIKNKNISGYCIAHFAAAKLSKLEALNCDSCGNDIKRSPSAINTTNFCSRKCAAAYRNLRAPARLGTGSLSEEDNAIKMAARIKLNHATDSGRVIRGTCIVCKTDQRIHGHHEDYDKPLLVKWYCSKHHHRLHLLMRRGIELNTANQIMRNM